MVIISYLYRLSKKWVLLVPKWGKNLLHHSLQVSGNRSSRVAWGLELATLNREGEDEMSKVTRFLAIVAAALFFFAVAAGVVMAMGGGHGGGGHGTPEIDPGFAPSAIALLTCGLLILTSRHPQKA